eukprot:11652.XXX_554360_552142_1 [CDS] Oithona nana genome sequencing.
MEQSQTSSPEPKTPKIEHENSQEIVQNIIQDVVHEIVPSHQLDGMAEEQQEEEQQTKESAEPVILAEEATVAKVAVLSKESSAESSQESAASIDMDNVYHVKWIGWNKKKVPIITQNANGPCPMLAIANVLLLRGKMTLDEGVEIVSSEQLLEYLGDTMLECVPKNLDPDRRLDYEANVSDAVILLPKLQTGIDVNVKFSGVSEFEYTPECIIFDLFNIVLYHGWLVDPQQEEVVKSVDGLSYNQLVEKIICDKNSSDSTLVSQSLVAHNFLEESASQLTYHGLCELVTMMKENELAIFFRNNHFSTIYKHKDEIFLLVTDQGFLKENSVVWETLNSIDGDGQFVDSEFITAPPKASPKVTSTQDANLSPEQQLEQDLQLAKALGAQDQRDDDWESYKQTRLGDTSGLTDEELAKKLQDIEESVAEQQQDEQLARRLQEEENQEESSPQRPSPPSTSRPSGSPGRSAASANAGQPSSTPRTKNCTIL